ncbi:pogo transposable element with KRAB domain isoform X2 [Rhizophagus clarus]|uniref:Pogo transposable element with KRAB domain isoform X2 n=1 Tax=Rhizophagus clarus TaxID=94130 RepID=A0A8H3M6N3_9GLOM|nr:pogo transposable element with KRAB domain isoform X2 [Rhizophagus clarus]
MIVHYFENNNRNVHGTAKKFNIQPKQLRDWSNKKGTLLTTAPHISEKRANGNAITRKIITNKTILLSKSPEFLANNPGNAGFKFSPKWLDGFLGKYDLSEHCRTTVVQQLPSDLIEKQNIFLSYVMYLRIHNKYELKYIGNMDETPMWFDLPSNTTINQKGAKMVNIRMTDYEQSSFTVILACMADDSFRGHIVDSVKNRLVKKNTNMAVIFGGCTSKLQPLDVVINKNFKSKVRDRYNNWMISNIHAFTLTGKIKRPSYSTVTTWVKESWDEISEDLIQRSFKSCGISTNLDGSEDDCIGDHDSLLDRDNKMIENSDDSTDENYEEYAEEVDYENKWNIEVDQKEDQEEDNDENEGKGEDSGNYNYQDSDDEEIRHRLKKLNKIYKMETDNEEISVGIREQEQDTKQILLRSLVSNLLIEAILEV